MSPAAAVIPDVRQSGFGRRGTLSGFLLGGPTPPLDVLRSAHLGAWAYTVLPADDALRPELCPDFLAALTRHHRIRSELIALLRAWSAAGVQPLLFKGFWLAEFVYPVPGARFHGDVDVLLPRGSAAAAAEIAAAQGWASATAKAFLRHPYSHVAFGIERDGGAARIDGHHLVLHSRTRWNAPQVRVTDAVRERSREREWEGILIREPDPVDALLILVLQRCWGDNWGLKPADTVDFRMLVERFGCSRDDIWRRAGELRCTRTLRLFLERCDPGIDVLDLRPLSRWRRLRLNAAVIAERPTLLFERRARLALIAPVVLLDVVRALPTVARVWLALRRQRPIPDILAGLTPTPRPVRSSRTRSVRGIRWAIRLLRMRPQGACLLRSLAVYHALRRGGWNVEFVSGVRSDDDGLMSHAWVELDGRILPELREPQTRARFTENYRYPPRAHVVARAGH